MKNLSTEYLNECFAADFEAGILTWRVRPVAHFKASAKQTAEHNTNSWNSNNAGKVAGTPNVYGYFGVRIDGRIHKVHRVIYAMATGAWPRDTIDHINGVRDDNRIVNLRDVTQEVNHRNRTKSFVGGTSKYTGVCWAKRAQKWLARIRIDGVLTHLGLFADELDAAAAYRAAAEEHGRTEAHIRAADGTMPPLPAKCSEGV